MELEVRELHRGAAAKRASIRQADARVALPDIELVTDGSLVEDRRPARP